MYQRISSLIEIGPGVSLSSWQISGGKRTGIQYLANGEVSEVLDDTSKVLGSIVGEVAIGQIFESDFERLAGLA